MKLYQNFESWSNFFKESHFSFLMNPFNVHNKNHFSYIEDKNLINVVEQLGTSDWQKVAKMMPGRNSRQCKDRWEKFLSPAINRGPYTQEEDEMLLQQYDVYGSQWVKIASHLKGRSDASVKARYKLIMRHRTSRSQKFMQDDFSACDVSDFGQAEEPLDVFGDDKPDCSLQDHQSLSDDPDSYFESFEEF